MRRLRRIFGIGCAISAISWLAGSTQADQPEFPFTAYISIDNAYVRSGPGKRYYPTDKLVRGDEVEVYRADPGGWLAIRPPSKSYSWIPASSLQPTKDHLAIITGDHVPSRVGSRLSDSHNVMQVRLEHGEEVEILAADTLTINGQQELWCKIAPPSGEFRFIYGRFVDRNKPAPLPPQVVSEPIPPAVPVAPFAATPVAAAPADPKPTVATADAGSFEANLTAIDLTLSAVVVQDMSAWILDELERRAERLLDQAQGTDERSRAHQLLDRISKFEDIKRRSAAVARLDTLPDSRPDRSRLQLTAMTTASSAAPLTATAAFAGSPTGMPPHYDATGLLANVKSRRPNAPPFVLLDTDRRPIAFVTPAPGLNLRPLVGHQVGISGARGYIPEFQKPHVTAMQADPLDGSDVILALRDQMRR